MSDFLLDAIAQFLKGNQWLRPINDFMSTNKAIFSQRADSEEKQGFSIDQHSIFLEFKSLVDRLLERVLHELGCDAAIFVEALENAVREEAGGPKEEEVQILVKTLLSYDDFEVFCTLMRNYADPSTFLSNSEATMEVEVEAFNSKMYLKSPEWLLQDVLATSLLEAFDAGQLSPDDEAYLPWAHAIIEIKAEHIAKSSSAKMEDTQKSDSKWTELQANLVKERLKVDLLVAQRLSERNAGMRLEMANLCQYSKSRSANGVDAADDVEALPLTEEEELDALFNRMAAIQDELKAIKKRCFAVKSLSQLQLDEIYLYLKEKVHHKHDLAQCHEDMTSYLFARLSPEEIMIIPDLLQWLLLESELHEAQNEVQARTFQTSHAQAKGEEGDEIGVSTDISDHWVRHWSEENQSYYYSNGATGTSQWERPMSKDGKPIVGYWDDGTGQFKPFEGEHVADAKQDETQKGEDEVCKEGSWALEWQNKTQLQELQLQDIGIALEQALSSRPSSSSSTAPVFDIEESLEKVLHEHDIESKKLEIALQVEHARQLQGIQRRRAQRREERKLKKRKKEGVEEEKHFFSPEEKTSLETSSWTAKSLPPVVVPHVSVDVGNPGKMTLMQLLSKADERMRKQRLSLKAQGDASLNTNKSQASTALNTTSLRYLTEKVIQAQPTKLIEIEEI